MDAFLRRVIAQRDLEQERAMAETRFAAVPCRICGNEVNATEAPQLTVCTGCGGRKKERQLGEEDQERARAVNRANRLLGLVGIFPESKMEERRMCSTPGCGRSLRSNNRTGLCTSCKYGAGAAAPLTPVEAKTTSAKKQFKTVTEALEIDGEALLEEFMTNWLARVRSSVKKDSEDDLL